MVNEQLDSMNLEDLVGALRELFLKAQIAGKQEFSGIEVSIKTALIAAICRIQLIPEVIRALTIRQFDEFEAAEDKAALLNKWYAENKATAEQWLDQQARLDEGSDDDASIDAAEQLVWKRVS